MTPETPYLTTNEMIKELNRRGYVVSLFNYDSWDYEDTWLKMPNVYQVQGSISNEYYNRFDELFGDIVVEIAEEMDSYFDED